MLNAFWQGVAGSLAAKWTQRVFAPAFLFWLGGFLCLVWRDGWAAYRERWAALDAGQLLLVIAAGLVLVAASAAVIRQLDAAMLRLLEGYWPHWPGVKQLRAWLARRYRDSIQQAEETLAQLEKQGLDNLSAEDLERWSRAEAHIYQAPRNPQQVMPTRLGNILRAAERRPRARYGLETAYVWPRLWLLLPERARKEVGEAREGLNSAVRVVAWGLLFVLWSFAAWWAFIPGLLAAAAAYRWALNQARTYGDLLDACFDLHRFDLYQALRWPLPASSAKEKVSGEALSRYLHRGLTDNSVKFL